MTVAVVGLDRGWRITRPQSLAPSVWRQLGPSAGGQFGSPATSTRSDISGEEELLASGREKRWKKSGASGAHWKDHWSPVVSPCPCRAIPAEMVVGRKSQRQAPSPSRYSMPALKLCPRPCPTLQIQAPRTARAGPLAARDGVGAGIPGGRSV